MRRWIIVLFGCVVTLAASTAVAQVPSVATAPAPPPAIDGQEPSAWIDFGVRGTSVSGDEGRFQRYRDVRNGLFVDRARYEREHGDWVLELGADNVGYRDQAYLVRVRRPGVFEAFFSWDQVPLYFSSETATPYSQTSPGVLELTGLPSRDVAPAQIGLANAAALASPMDLLLRRDVATFGFRLMPTRTLDARVTVRSYRDHGQQPWGASFGFNEAVTVPLTVDARNTDLEASLDWGGSQRVFRIAYDASWFRNAADELTWDNPARSSDATGPTGYVTGLGAARGRMALAPDNTAQTVTGAGMIRLPRRSQVSASLSVGTWRQDAALLPVTSNSAIPDQPLPRGTADADVRRIGANLQFTSRPVDDWFVRARYRGYDFDNRTPPFELAQHVVFDQTLTASPVETDPFGFATNSAEVEAEYSRWRRATLGVGYTLDTTSRTFRIFDRTTDQGVHATVSGATFGWVTLRGIVEHSRRSGSGLDESMLREDGEQPTLRRYDIANRTRNRASAIVQVIPAQAYALSFTASAARDRYDDTGFGLLNNGNQAYTAAIDVFPGARASAGLQYGIERYTALQRSRQADPTTLNDPRLDWTADEGETVHYVTARADVQQIAPRTDLRFAYDFNRSRDRYVFGQPAGSTLPPPVQWTPIVNSWNSATVDVRYHAATHVAVSLTYWHDQYSADDFGQGLPLVDRLAQPGILLLGYGTRPYTANSAWLRAMLYW